MFDLIPFNQMDAVINEFTRVLKPDGKLVLVNMTKAEQFGAGLYERIYRIHPLSWAVAEGFSCQTFLLSMGLRLKSENMFSKCCFH